MIVGFKWKIGDNNFISEMNNKWLYPLHALFVVIEGRSGIF